MACTNCNKKPIWEFTNKTKLCKNCFTDYFERKIFRTIRKYRLLPKSRIIKIKKSADINTKVLVNVLQKKFKIEFSKNPDISPKNLSESAEDIFLNLLKGRFKSKTFDKKSQPLLFLSDKEIEVYAKINNIKGKSRTKNKKAALLFEKFTLKNPDLEHNILNAFSQLD